MLLKYCVNTGLVIVSRKMMLSLKKIYLSAMATKRTLMFPHALRCIAAEQDSFILDTDPHSSSETKAEVTVLVIFFAL